MSVKVVATEITKLVNPTYSPFTWVCKGCGEENTDEVRDMILLEYKAEKLGTMRKSVKCSKCKSKHEVRLVLG